MRRAARGGLRTVATAAKCHRAPGRLPSGRGSNADRPFDELATSTARRIAAASRQRRHQPGREPVVIERVDSQVENRSQTPVERLTARWPEDDTAWLTGFLQVIGEQYPNSVNAVIVYGSMARGDWHKDSDLDVLIVLSDEHAAERDAIELAAYGLSVRLETLPSILSLTETEWADEEGGSLHRETSRDGITVL